MGALSSLASRHAAKYIASSDTRAIVLGPFQVPNSVAMARAARLRLAPHTSTTARAHNADTPRRPADSVPQRPDPVKNDYTAATYRDRGLDRSVCSDTACSAQPWSSSGCAALIHVRKTDIYGTVKPRNIAASPTMYSAFRAWRFSIMSRHPWRDRFLFGTARPADRPVFRGISAAYAVLRVASRHPMPPRLCPRPHGIMCRPHRAITHSRNGCSIR
jgi:hypothetical protein